MAKIAIHEGATLISVECGGTVAEGRPVKYDAAGKIVHATAAADVSIGIVQSDGVSGDLVRVCVLGPSDAVSHGAMTAGTDQRLGCAANGLEPAGALHVVIAQWVPTVANLTPVAGDVIKVILTGAGKA